MAVVLELVRDGRFADDPEACERIRQAVASHGRTMRQEVDRDARIEAFREASEA